MGALDLLGLRFCRVIGDEHRTSQSLVGHERIVFSLQWNMMERTQVLKLAEEMGLLTALVNLRQRPEIVP